MLDVKAIVWVDIEMPDEYGKEHGKNPVGEKNVSLVEVVHVSRRRCLLEEDRKAGSEHRGKS